MKEIRCHERNQNHNADHHTCFFKNAQQALDFYYPMQKYSKNSQNGGNQAEQRQQNFKFNPSSPRIENLSAQGHSSNSHPPFSSEVQFPSHDGHVYTHRWSRRRKKHRKNPRRDFRNWQRDCEDNSWPRSKFYESNDHDDKLVSTLLTYLITKTLSQNVTQQRIPWHPLLQYQDLR